MAIHRSLRISVVIIIALALFASLSLVSAQEQLPTGGAVFRDSAALSDSLVITLSTVPAPAAGREYEGWLLSDDQKTRLSIGKLRVISEAINATYVSPTKANLAATFSVFAITVEPSPDTSPDPSGTFAYSAAVHSGAMTHVRHLVVAYDPNPAKKGIAVGLREQVRLARTYAGQAQAATTLAELKQNAERVGNIIDVSPAKDLDKNGTVDNPGDGKGALGYAADAKTHAGLAKTATTTDKTVQAFADNVIASSDNVTAWAKQARDQALLAIDATDLTVARIFANNLKSVMDWAADGRDADGSGAVDPVAGEAGADTVYLESQNIATFVLAKGAPAPPPAPPKPPVVGEPGIPTLALITLLGGLALTGVGGALLLRRRRTAS